MKRGIGALLVALPLFAVSATSGFAATGWACYAHGQKDNQQYRDWETSRSEAADQVMKGCERSTGGQSCVLEGCREE